MSSLIMHALIQTDRQLLMVIERAHGLSSRDIVLTSGGNRGKRHVAARVAAIVPLSLSGFLSKSC